MKRTFVDASCGETEVPSMPETGLEPARDAMVNPLAPQAGAFADSATLARAGISLMDPL